MSSVRFTTCPVESCGVTVGSRHSRVCTIARCKEHGEQFFSCTKHGEHTPSLFKGDYPGATEAIERGWFVRLAEGKGWVPCAQSDPQAMPDMNRVIMELTWDSVSETFK